MRLKKILCLGGLLSLSLLPAQSQNYTAMKIERYRQWAKGQVSLVPLEIGQIMPEGRLRQWGDRIENVFLNAGPTSIARDWKMMLRRSRGRVRIICFYSL